MNDKLLNKIKKKLGAVIEELDAKSEQDLEKTVYQAEEAVETATMERDANTKYQEAKLAVSDLSSGLKDVKAYQGAKKQYALYRLRQIRGEES